MSEPVLITQGIMVDDLVQQIVNSVLEKIPVASETMKPEIITTEELLKRLAISESTLIAWRKKNKIPFIQLNGVIRYNWVSVIDALEKQKKYKS